MIKRSDARHPARRRVAAGLERVGAGLLRGATCTGQEARAGEAGAGIFPPDRQGPTVGWRPDPRRRLQLGPGKGLEFNVAAEAVARAPDPQ